MMGGVQLASAARSAVALCCLVAAGCAAVTQAPTVALVDTAIAPAAVNSAPSEPAPSELAAAEPAPIEPAPTASAPAPAAAVPALPPVGTAAPTTAVALATEPSFAAAPVTAPPDVAPPLDFTSLAARLRHAKTIGMLAKLSVKSQADALLDQFRAYHRRQGPATLPELRTSYDTLLMKVLSIVQDSDPPLARDIVQSRAAIWDILADPRKFTESNLLAGASQ
jgi:hypothetical protein